MEALLPRNTAGMTLGAGCSDNLQFLTFATSEEGTGNEVGPSHLVDFVAIVGECGPGDTIRKVDAWRPSDRIEAPVTLC